ncbi:type II toxin-antitoxin system VapC family toxin [Aquiflexum gelatinilyticum]|uniref:Ribonuclease VapC n=1 Tax=Aquiflexum gelatinilyticum TaxID=2961943 RepID=A0A9X2T1A0_9BACT|nr:type II toxin-antitoxin system VapC family toxin [Aquiflexum gelatinilyticum]MCR9014450.1 type II toxin-antitoxin system VapC family toxin [Aquiflexum gelatinilyticum]MCS4435443.1 type II toxin-antitoxin system VapC family toxin [Aquiflexum gelatinilyticum]
MKYLLDTNICIHFLRGKFGMIEKFQELGTENFAISEITFAELVFGAENSTNPKKNLELIEIFSNQVLILPIFNAIYLYGKEKARLRSKGLMISDFDLLIGCTAVDKDLIMVTENQKEFERISGIEIENWVKR